MRLVAPNYLLLLLEMTFPLLFLSSGLLDPFPKNVMIKLIFHLLGCAYLEWSDESGYLAQSH